MVFSTIQFLCAFLPVLFCAYTALSLTKSPHSTAIQNWLLLVASVLFYAYGEPIYVLLLIVSSLLNYLFALAIDKVREKHRKPVLIADVVINLALLGVFKYTGMMVTTANAILGTHIPVPQITLPVGISFFTFQALSYVIDVYRGQARVQKRFDRVLLYISLFPQLIAGPIVKFHDIDRELTERTQTIEGTAAGLRRFIVGLAKKVLVSNVMAAAADAVFSAQPSEINVLSAWIGAAAYMLQIYYDFSGYSDMALGMGRMFGFHFQENFDYPYIADSIRGFWRRWHISLSSWFRDYLYIPLGGNRKGRARTALNKLIVFFCTGLWHGASWTFVVWGLYHGGFMMLEEYVPRKRKIPAVLMHLYTLIVVCVGFVIFRADTLGQGLHIIGQMFGGWHFGAQDSALALSQLTPLFVCVFIVAVVGSVPVGRMLRPLAERSGVSASVLSAASYASAVVLLIMCVASLAGGTYNPFIYFRF